MAHIVWLCPQLYSLEGASVEIICDTDGNPKYYKETLCNNILKKLNYEKTSDKGSRYYLDENGWGIWIDKESVQVNFGTTGVSSTTRVYKTHPDKIQSNGNNTNNSIDIFTPSGGSSSGITYTTCRTCNGSGTCTSCNGRRGYYVDSGMYTGSGSRTWQNCPSCNGNGRCFNCHGTGRY